MSVIGTVAAVNFTRAIGVVAAINFTRGTNYLFKVFFRTSEYI